MLRNNYFMNMKFIVNFEVIFWVTLQDVLSVTNKKKKKDRYLGTQKENTMELKNLKFV